MLLMRMSSNKSVVLGEAPESDSEEIPLREEHTSSSPDYSANNKRETTCDNEETFSEDNLSRETNVGAKTSFSSSLLASIGSSSTLAKLVGYSPYNLITQGGSQTNAASKFTQASRIQDAEEQLPLLHKTLLNKNQQLYASMAHIKRYPYEKASKDLNTISGRLVGIQKIIQEANVAVMKIGKEHKTLDMDIKMIS